MPYHRGMNKLRHFFESGALSVSDLARGLDVSVPTVAQWCRGTRPVPIARCLAIERMTDGAVTRQDLRPDDWREIWPDIADSKPIRPTAPANQARVAIKTVAQEVTHG